MNNKKKILLGEKDIMSKDNEDLFININLNSTFSEIRDYKYDNVFDVEKQWKKERNASRDFRIYGIVDSTIIDCDNLTIYAYDSGFPGTGINSGTTQVSGLVATITSSELVYNGLNSYAKKRGKYLLELTGYTKDFVYLQIRSNNFNYKDQVYPQQLIFRDADGNFIEYGTQTIDITENGDAVEVNNDFYFLYNKHWVKKDLDIIEEKPATISFSASPLSETVSETPLPSTTTVYSVFSVVLDKPSPFGLEQAIMDVSTTTLDPFAEIGVFDSSFASQTLPITIDFAPGEQIKNFYFASPTDDTQEFIEDVTFELYGFNLVNTGSPLQHTFFVTDTTQRNVTNFNFQNIYQNRNYFTGIVREVSTQIYSYQMPAVLRNGLDFEGTPMEFYPSDNFTLKIRNIGGNTILPVNPSLGVGVEQLFLAGQTLAFNVQPQYQNAEKHSIKFYFSKFNETSNALKPFLSSYQDGIMINGIPVVDYYRQYKVDYEKFLACLKNTTIASTPYWFQAGTNISGWNRYPGIDIPFDVEENLTDLTITITAKSPGTRLDITPYKYSLGVLTAGTLFDDIFIANSVSLQTLGLTAETIQEFVHSAQTQLEILLGANIGNNLQAQYEFELSKVGFDTMKFTSSQVNASITPPTYYLSSGYHDILRNWDDGTNQIVYNGGNITSNWSTQNYSQNGFYKSGEVYVNGILFLANKYFDNTQNTGTYINGGSINLSHFTNVTGDYSADFLLAPITTIPETSSYYSPQDTGQIAYLAMKIGYSSSLPAGADPQRSFDFRTGETALYNTYYTDYYMSQYASWHWNTYNDFYSSGGTVGTNLTTSTRSIKNFLQDGYAPYGITSQGLTGTSPVSFSTAEAQALSSLIYPANPNLFPSSSNFIKLESQPGIPFEITNIKEVRYTSGPNIGQNLLSTPSLGFIITQEAQVAGVTINKGNNHMGGYSLVRPGAPITPSTRSVSFEFPVYNNTAGPITIKISLNTASINGDESVVILKTGGSALLGLNYTESQTYPYTITWAIGEKDKFITFNNISPFFIGNKSLNLQISSLINVNPGPYVNSVFYIN
jgi:hypothetical protein